MCANGIDRDPLPYSCTKLILMFWPAQRSRPPLLLTLVGADSSCWCSVTCGVLAQYGQDVPFKYVHLPGMSS